MLIEINAQYLFKASDTLSAYGLAGLRHSRVTAEASFMGQSRSQDADDSGLQFGGGAEFSLGGTLLFAEGILGLGDNDELVVNFGARFAL
jgi:opacity protein-like surface antigen